MIRDLARFVFNLALCVAFGALIVLFAFADLWTRMQERFLG